MKLAARKKPARRKLLPFYKRSPMHCSAAFCSASQEASCPAKLSMVTGRPTALARRTQSSISSLLRLRPGLRQPPHSLPPAEMPSGARMCDCAPSIKHEGGRTAPLRRWPAKWAMGAFRISSNPSRRSPAQLFLPHLFPDFHAQQPRELHGLHGRNDGALQLPAHKADAPDIR